MFSLFSFFWKLNSGRMQIDIVRNDCSLWRSCFPSVCSSPSLRRAQWKQISCDPKHSGSTCRLTDSYTQRVWKGERGRNFFSFCGIEVPPFTHIWVNWCQMTALKSRKFCQENTQISVSLEPRARGMGSSWCWRPLITYSPAGWGQLPYWLQCRGSKISLMVGGGRGEGCE